MIGTAIEVTRWVEEQAAERGADALFEVKPRTKARSLTQNAYYWSMLNDLARVLRMPDSEVHGRMLRDYGASVDFSVRADVPVEGYFRYFDIVGYGFIDGAWYRTVRAYKGSSEMDSAEFSRLIDGMRQECEAQGIAVMTPAEIARLRFVEGAA